MSGVDRDGNNKQVRHIWALRETEAGVIQVQVVFPLTRAIEEEAFSGLKPETNKKNSERAVSQHPQDGLSRRPSYGASRSTHLQLQLRITSSLRRLEDEIQLPSSLLQTGNLINLKRDVAARWVVAAPRSKRRNHWKEFCPEAPIPIRIAENLASRITRENQYQRGLPVVGFLFARITFIRDEGASAVE